MSRDRFRPPTFFPPGIPGRYGDSLRFPPPPSPPSSGNLPMLILSIFGVLAASILLLAYYFIGDQCCFCRRRPDAFGGSRRRLRDNFMVLAVGARGLGAAEIRRIPTFQYHKESGAGDCAVCLGELQEEETIRLLPDCFHVFHVNCIDMWLQSNDNCPLCRVSITPASASTPVPFDRLPGFARSRGFDQRNRSDYVVIDVKDDEREIERRRQLRRHRSFDAGRPPPTTPAMWRSFSVGSAMATDGGGAGEGSSGANRVRRGLFSFQRTSISGLI